MANGKENGQVMVDAILVNVFAAAVIASGRVVLDWKDGATKPQCAVDAFDMAEAMLAESKERFYADVDALSEAMGKL